jgi:hypothetical protein
MGPNFQKAKMQPYLTPACLLNKPTAPDTRQVDKTSLICWQSNKYSVPMAYQSSKVGISTNAGPLQINDLASGDIIAEQAISLKKARSLKTPIIIGK